MPGKYVNYQENNEKKKQPYCQNNSKIESENCRNRSKIDTTNKHITVKPV